jgi:hypothetical protein
MNLSRREAVRRIIAASAMIATLDFHVSAGAAEAPAPIIGFDPNLLKKEIPWPRILTPAEKAAVTALADVILPADDFGPAASALGVPDFIDEWVSAPYEPQVKDHAIIREGLAWLDAQAAAKFAGKPYAQCAVADQTALLEQIVGEGNTSPKEALEFFRLFRDRVIGGYYTTPEGWKAIGYVGNAPQAEFPAPPAEVLAKLGLA